MSAPNQKQSKAEELFFVVDEHDQPLAPLPRRQVHGSGIWHRVSHIALVNDHGDILCHQRAFTKELDPDGYSTALLTDMIDGKI